MRLSNLCCGRFARPNPLGTLVNSLIPFGRLHAPGSLRRIGLLLALVTIVAGKAHAATYYVNNQSPSATDAGAGTLAQPYRTITAAVNQRGGPGNTVEVLPGVYREQVSVSASGAAGNPFVIRASGPGVVIEGSELFATAAQWVQFSGNVWLASGVTWATQQVIANGQRLLPSIVAPASLPAGSFTYVAGTGLYVNVGGGNPGGQGTLVGRYTYGFSVPARNWVNIVGFEIRRSDTKGIFASGATTNCEFRGNTIWRARLSGIHMSGGSNYTVAANTLFDNGDHGVYLTGGVTGSTIRDNDSYRNARITARAANGFHVFGSPSNRLERNRSHQNEDAGFQINSGSNDVVLINNRSWNNGDHGYDHLNSTGVTHIHNVSSGNLRDGISFEGASQNARVYNCISVNNGVTTNRADFFVDATSAASFQSDYNLFWNSAATAPVRIGNVPYTTVAAYAGATGKDTHSRQADPQFVNATGGDFHLLATSPAIDAATSAVPNWPALDAEGHARFDVPTVANQGAGPVTFADLGAFEFSAAVGNQPPIAALVVQPTSGTAPLRVTANGTTSRDPDGTIVSYTFDFGDETIVGPQTTATATHTYAAGTWTARVTVKDNGGLTNSATARVVVNARSGDRAPIVVAPAFVTIAESHTLTVNITASDPDGDAIQSLTADLSKLPAGSNAKFVANDTRTGGTLTWKPTYSDSGRYSVTFRAANALAGTATTIIRVTNVDRAPVVSSPSNYHVGPGSLIVFTVRAVDPDGDPIRSLTVDLGRMPSNSGAKFIVLPTNIAGVFTWFVGLTVDGNFKAKFTATNALEGSSKTNFHVKPKDRGGRGGKGGGLGSEETEIALPAVLALSNGSPNPAAGPIDFALDLPRAATVQWAVFDVQGRAVWSEERSIGAGTARLHWDGTSSRGERVAKGIYLARVRVDGTQFMRRIVRL